MNNMRVMAAAPTSVDERIARESRPGEIRFKQVKLVDKKNKNEIIFLVRKIWHDLFFIIWVLIASLFYDASS